jgi:AcrR family transcriptional regulator
MYVPSVPKLWTATIETHRREVADAILDTAWKLLDHLGLRELTMSRVAEDTGIGRATLYKYFPDVDAIVVALHQRHVDGQLARLTALAEGEGDAVVRLRSVLEAYALLRQEHQGTAVEAWLHGSEAVVRGHDRLVELLARLLAEGAEARHVRDDVPPRELAHYCVAALAAAGRLPTKAAARRLVQVIVDGVFSGD